MRSTLCHLPAGLLAFLLVTPVLTAQPAVKLTPYGIVWTNMVWESSRTNNGDYVFFVHSPDAEGEPAFHMDAKSTRIGVNLEGPSIGELVATGKLEVDFQGSFVIENKPGILVRHAYWQLANDHFKVLAGLTWDIVSPLIPGTLNYTVGWGAGNIGYRRMQLRGEYSGGSETARVLLQGSINAGIVSDFAASSAIVGDNAEYPTVEGRLAVGLGNTSKANAAFGVSAHYGEHVFDFAPLNPGYDKRLETWSVNGDGRIDLGGFGVQGEVFTGTNLGAYLGGVLQGICDCREQDARSTGGWVDVFADLAPTVHAHAGFGIDDPKDEDFGFDHKRTYNRFIFANISVNVTKQLLMGVEGSHWRTEYKALETGEAFHANVMARYSF